MSSPACPSRRATRAADHASLKVEQVEEKARGSGLPRGKWPKMAFLAQENLRTPGKIRQETWKTDRKMMN